MTGEHDDRGLTAARAIEAVLEESSKPTVVSKNLTVGSAEFCPEDGGEPIVLGRCVLVLVNEYDRFIIPPTGDSE